MIITDGKQMANIMNDHFVSITKKLSLKSSISSKDSNSEFFHDHISVKEIKEIYPKIVLNSFKFEPVIKDNIKNQIQKLSIKKIVRICLYFCISVKSIWIFNKRFKSYA